MLQHSESFLTDVEEDEFSDALEEYFFDASDSLEFEHSLSVSDSSSVINLDDINHDSVSKSTFSDGLRRRRHFSRQSSKEFRFRNSSDGLADFDVLGSDVSPTKSYKFSWKLKDKHKLNVTRVHVSSGGVGKRLYEESNGNSLNSRAIINLTDDDQSVSDGSVTVDSPNTGSNFLFIAARLIIRVITLQTSLLVTFVSFPIRLTRSCYIFLTNPLAFMRRAKRCMKRIVSSNLKMLLSNVKGVVHKLMKRNKSAWKLCVQLGRGLLWAAFIGFILVGLLVLAFASSCGIMKYILEVPVQKVEPLNFDYTRDTPMAFMPIMSCPESFCLECNESSNVAARGVIPPDHKLQATVSLIMPESNYNRNLGNFQVRVDFLSSNGKSLASKSQPSMLKFKSRPIRLLMTIVKLAPLITGYSSESQSVSIKFTGYTEGQTPTSCLRVALEPRTNRRGGVPEIYAASIKLESRLPVLKRILWSWKATIFVWTSIIIFIAALVFMLLCCISVFVFWSSRASNLNNS